MCFLNFYNSRLGDNVGWLSLVGQQGKCMFDPFTLSYKNFKTSFFNVTVEPTSHQYFYDDATI